MWFRLKEDYKTQEDEIHFGRWYIKIIKKGAPISVALRFDAIDAIRREVNPEFIFSSGGLKHLSLSMLELPGKCSMDENINGNIFCATKKKFFCAGNELGTLVGKQMDFCPLCGNQLEILKAFPLTENKKQYEVLGEIKG
jgi:hypothetical protein